MTAERVLMADVGQGFSTYALVGGDWYSVNLHTNGTIADERWAATIRERDQITSILVSRANRKADRAEELNETSPY